MALALLSSSASGAAAAIFGPAYQAVPRSLKASGVMSM